jgi:hypothetical protein
VNILACHAESAVRFARGESGAVWLPFLALCGMLSLGYLFALPVARGWPAWALRIFSALAFVGICAAVTAVR